MTNEPVAYLQLDIHGKEMVHIEKDMNGYETEPLYTAEQLHPRVKMTSKEFDEFNHLYLFYPSLYSVLYHVNHSPEDYPILNKKLFDEYPRCTAAQKVFSNLHNTFDPEHPEETIEIVPEMKWFVRSKEQYQPDMDQGISESGYLYLMQGNFYKVDYYLPTPFKDDAEQFDTKEQAEEWTNPLTEAVHLPVEDE